jgi:hypothetical protein
VEGYAVERQIETPFSTALRRVLSVSKDDLKVLLAREKAKNADKPKRGPKPTRK